MASAAVERWRPLVEQYFQPQDVEKALRVIEGESGGDPAIKARIPSEQSWGLFQHNIGNGLGTGYTAEQLQDPETNVKIAAQAVYGGSGWTPWGEGVTYEGQPFGSLGVPGPASTGSGGDKAMGTDTIQQRFQAAADQAWGILESVRAEIRKPRAAGDGYDAEAEGEITDEEIEKLGKVQSTWLALENAATGNVKDVYGLQVQYIDMLNDVGLAEHNVFKGMSDTENKRRIDEYGAKSQEFANQVAAGRLTLDQARDQLDRWVKGRQEGRARSEFVEKTLAEAAPWATSGGKRSFTAAELGGGNAALARGAGRDPNEIGITFSGVRTVDPLGQLAAQDRAMGVEGPMPGIPVLPQLNVPSAPGLTPFNRTPPTLQRPGAPPDVNALMNEPPGSFAQIPVTPAIGTTPALTSNGLPVTGTNMPPTGNRVAEASGLPPGYVRTPGGGYAAAPAGIPVTPGAEQGNGGPYFSFDPRDFGWKTR